MTAPKDVTQLLQAGAGAHDELLERIYAELKTLALGRMKEERSGHTLQATALVHEAWLRLVGDERMSWRDRRHFYAAASEAMRRVLIDHARKVGAQKRGGSAQRVTLGAVEDPLEVDARDLSHLNEVLERLAEEDERAAAVATLRFLSGLSVEETAKALDTSVRTVHREWAFARARLTQLLSEHAD